MGKRLNQPRVINIGSTKSDDIRNHKWQNHLPLVNQSSSTILQSFCDQKFVVHMNSFMNLECLPIRTMFHTGNVLTTPLLLRPPKTHVEHFKKVPSNDPHNLKTREGMPESWKDKALFSTRPNTLFEYIILIGTKCSKSLSTKKFE
jgi:hypothetical protein